MEGRKKKGDETPAHGIEKLICFSLDRSSNGLIGDQRRNGRDRAIRISPSNCFDTRVPIFPPPLFSSSSFFSPSLFFRVVEVRIEDTEVVGTGANPIVGEGYNWIGSLSSLSASFVSPCRYARNDPVSDRGSPFDGTAYLFD